METWSLFLLATASASFHLTAVPVGAALFALATLVWLGGARRRVRPLLVLGPLLLALARSLSFSYALFQRLTLTPNSPPHGWRASSRTDPAASSCAALAPQSGFELCDYLDPLPATEERILVAPAARDADSRTASASRPRHQR